MRHPVHTYISHLYNLGSKSVLSSTKQRYKDLEARNMIYKKHAPLFLIVLIGLFASTAYGSNRGCTGKLEVELQYRGRDKTVIIK